MCRKSLAKSESPAARLPGCYFYDIACRVVRNLFPSASDADVQTLALRYMRGESIPLGNGKAISRRHGLVEPLPQLRNGAMKRWRRLVFFSRTLKRDLDWYRRRKSPRAHETARLSILLGMSASKYVNRLTKQGYDPRHFYSLAPTSFSYRVKFVEDGDSLAKEITHTHQA